MGIQRVRRRIPSNHNPFHYHDRSIISIDTLKQDREYRTYLENAWWDIIVIDEAHNVAERATRSQRSRLAKRLCKRSDTLIMLSATPHDGKARSFASLMNMLDPTAIGDPDDFTQEDFRDKGLVIRRFKKDVREQVKQSFRDRQIIRTPFTLSGPEEAATDAMLAVPVGGKSGKSGRQLFSVTLEKALFSSPAACSETVQERRRKLGRELTKGSTTDRTDAIHSELEGLERLTEALEAIRPAHFAKYQALLRAIRGGEPFRWTSRHARDRLVIFSERLATLRWLREHLSADLRLKPKQVDLLHGGLADRDQQEMVEAFGNETTPIRLLLASDVASEGINLHHQCHRLIHFDIPWSLMVFAQRNGRVDRYGQRRDPKIVYLLAESANETVQGDARVLEVLIEKDQQAHKNIGDPSVFMNQHDVRAEEEVTRKAIAAGETAHAFDARLTPKPKNKGDELMALFLRTPPADADPSEHPRHAPTEGVAGQSAGRQKRSGDAAVPHSLFPDDLAYCEAAFEHLSDSNAELHYDVNRSSRTLTLDAPADLRARFRQAPPEIKPRDWRFVLTADRQAMEQAIADSRRRETDWPRVHHLWRLNPVLQWLNDRMLAAFGRHVAPVLAGVPGLGSDEAVVIVSGQVANRKGHPLVSEWLAIRCSGAAAADVEPFADFAERVELGYTSLPNPGVDVAMERLRAVLAEAVELARLWVKDEVRALQTRMAVERDREIDALAELERRRRAKIEARRRGRDQLQIAGIANWRADSELREIDDAFTEYVRWVKDSMTVAGDPHISVVAVLTGGGRSDA